MSRLIVYAPEAEAQLLNLYRYIAREASPDIAQRFTESIIAHCEELTEFAERGTPRDDVRKGLHTLSFRRRVTIAYAVEPTRLLVLGIFYGGQDFETLLQDD